MIFGKEPTIKPGVLHTHTSYTLVPGTNVSAPRPFRWPGYGIAALLSGFGFSFHDILYLQELITLGGIAICSVIAGSLLAQLALTNAHLRGSTMTIALWGTYPHVNRLRRQVADAVIPSDRERGHG